MRYGLGKGQFVNAEASHRLIPVFQTADERIHDGQERLLIVGCARHIAQGKKGEKLAGPHDSRKRLLARPSALSPHHLCSRVGHLYSKVADDRGNASKSLLPRIPFAVWTFEEALSEDACRSILDGNK